MGTPQKTAPNTHWGTANKAAILTPEVGIVKGRCGRCGGDKVTNRRMFYGTWNGFETHDDGTLVTRDEAQQQLAATAKAWAEGRTPFHQECIHEEHEEALAVIAKQRELINKLQAQLAGQVPKAA